MNTIALDLALCVVLLGVCVFFNLAEVSLFSLQKVDREVLREQDSTAGRAILHMLSQPRRLLAALLIGVEFGNIALAAVSAELVTKEMHMWPWLNVVIVAPILVLFGDVLPKALGFHFARGGARLVARPLIVWNELVSPLRWVINGVAEAVLKAMGVRPPTESEALREEQLRVLIDQGRATGAIQPMEQEIIHRVFEFGDLPVSRMMTPRPDIFSRSLTTPWAELLAEIRDARYSRVPIWQGNPENIVGVLLVKDLLRLRNAPPPNARQLQKMLHPASFVPPSKRGQDLLREFRAKNNHMAIVVDEHGACQGLVTMDDLLTELVGELLDETDTIEHDVAPVEENVWTVRGTMDVEDFGNRFDVQVPEGDWTTLGGYVFHLIGAAPQKGDEVTWQGIVFHVSGVDGRRITEVTVHMPDASANQVEGE